ncbi:MAG: YbaN family protein [Phyllobacteriaceae bacterium]|jgi:uncharacterized membrane protein YbaN (DUF454 family)|nr:YbaN family protein [Phyllobacteriaceae bacterium]
MDIAQPSSYKQYFKYQLKLIMGAANGSKWTSAMTVRRSVWFVVGCAAIGVGAIGAILPVLPTTPFVILAAFAFGKSSPRLQAWLENSATFGPIIADWKANGAIALRYKAFALATMGAVLLLSFMMGFAPLVLIIQAIAITGAAVFIVSRPNHALRQTHAGIAPAPSQGVAPKQQGCKHAYPDVRGSLRANPADRERRANDADRYLRFAVPDRLGCGAVDASGTDSSRRARGHSA